MKAALETVDGIPDGFILGLRQHVCQHPGMRVLNAHLQEICVVETFDVDGQAFRAQAFAFAGATNLRDLVGHESGLQPVAAGVQL